MTIKRLTTAMLCSGAVAFGIAAGSPAFADQPSHPEHPPHPGRPVMSPPSSQPPTPPPGQGNVYAGGVLGQCNGHANGGPPSLC
jgi:hypothetical protein